jgi:hypothetical protein
MRYGNGLPVAGTYSGSLNNSGELVRIADVNAATIVQFPYGIASPWPTPANGGGFALILRNPETNPDHNVAANWRASYAPGGKPGGVDLLDVADWRTLYFTAADLTDPAKEATMWGNAADPDHDGLANLAELAFGSSPINVLSRGELRCSVWTDPDTLLQYFTLTCPLREGVTDILITGEASGDLVSWPDAVPQVGSFVSQGDGTAIATFRDTIPVSNTPGGSRFVRLRISQ